MNEKSFLRYFKLRASRLSYIIPLFFVCYYIIGIVEGQMMNHFLNIKAVEIRESDIDKHEKLFEIKRILFEREANLKYSRYRSMLRFLSSRNIYLITPARIVIISLVIALIL